MTTILSLTLIVCGLMVMFGSTILPLCVACASIVGCFSYLYFFVGEVWQSSTADALFCLLLLPIGWYGAKQFIKFEDSISRQ